MTYLVELVFTLSPARTIENLSNAVKPTVAVETKMHTGLRPYDNFSSSNRYFKTFELSFTEFRYSI